MSKRKQVSTLISTDHRRKLDTLRRRQGVTIAAFIEQAIDAAYRRVAKGKVKA
jgi:hypothetical protein